MNSEKKPPYRWGLEANGEPPSHSPSRPVLKRASFLNFEEKRYNDVLNSATTHWEIAWVTEVTERVKNALIKCQIAQE